MLFDPLTEELAILIDDLVIPNGVQMDSDKRCVFISEMGLYRIIKYFSSLTNYITFCFSDIVSINPIAKIMKFL